MRVPLSAVVPAAALAGEWLLYNDRGTLASGTVSGAQVRLRHTPLATTSADGRSVPLLLRLDARASAGNRVFDLTWRPRDPRDQPAKRAAIESFTRDPWLAWRYRAGDTTLEREQLLVHDRTALIAIWRHVDGPSVRLAVAPALAVEGGFAARGAPARDDDDGAAAESADSGDGGPERLGVQAIPGRVRFTAGGVHRLTLWHDGAFLPVRSWRR